MGWETESRTIIYIRLRTDCNNRRVDRSTRVLAAEFSCILASLPTHGRCRENVALCVDRILLIITCSPREMGMVRESEWLGFAPKLTKDHTRLIPRTNQAHEGFVAPGRTHVMRLGFLHELEGSNAEVAKFWSALPGEALFAERPCCTVQTANRNACQMHNIGDQ